MRLFLIAWADVQGLDIGFAVAALLVLVVSVKSVADWWQAARQRTTVAGQVLLSAITGPLLALGLGFLAYRNVHQRQLLHSETRYTAARVYENRHFKGDPESRFEYWVRGVRYTFDARMDWRGGWRPLGSYWYVRFAVADPDVSQYLDQPVPDSVRYAPAAGWVRLPGTAPAAQ